MKSPRGGSNVPGLVRVDWPLGTRQVKVVVCLMGVRQPLFGQGGYAVRDCSRTRRRRSCPLPPARGLLAAVSLVAELLVDPQECKPANLAHDEQVVPSEAAR